MNSIDLTPTFIACRIGRTICSLAKHLKALRLQTICRRKRRPWQWCGRSNSHTPCVVWIAVHVLRHAVNSPELGPFNGSAGLSFRFSWKEVRGSFAQGLDCRGTWWWAQAWREALVDGLLLGRALGLLLRGWGFRRRSPSIDTFLQDLDLGPPRIAISSSRWTPVPGTSPECV